MSDTVKFVEFGMTTNERATEMRDEILEVISKHAEHGVPLVVTLGVLDVLRYQFLVSADVGGVE